MIVSSMTSSADYAFVHTKNNNPGQSLNSFKTLTGLLTTVQAKPL